MPPFDDQERTEPPTPRRRNEARQSGHVAKSQDLNVAVLLVAVFLGLYFLGRSSVEKLAALMTGLLTRAAGFEFDGDSLVGLFSWILGIIVTVVLPFALLALLVGVAANLFQVGFLLSGEPLKPSIGKISPLRGFRRIFSIRGVTRTSFGILKIVIVGAVLVWTVWDELTRVEGDNMMLLLHSDWGHSLAYGLEVVALMGIRGGTALLILAILDYAYQKWQHEKDLMMTRQEVREETLRMEGNPRVKERRRRVQQQIAYQRMAREVPKADVVITNPVHVAVAIQYDRTTMAAPRCIAKGRDHMARRLREIAMEHGVPVVERPELARALHSGVEVGQDIPPDFYRAVAEVLAYVYRISRRRGPVARGVA